MGVAQGGSGGAPRTDVEVVIVGSGFSGLGMAITLRRAGLRDFVVLEKADRVGGTWRENDYPGCGCDVPSALYSFSFEPNPGWSRAFAGRAEIQAYLERCVDRHELRPHIRFGVEFTAASFDEAAGRWLISTSQGELSARALVLGLGPLHHPRIPDLPGMADFAGPVFHSARWRHDVDLAGKRVAVLGAGASAVQFVPEIAPKVSRLHVFQRTAPWVAPKPDRAISARRQAAYRRFPALQQAYRGSLFWRLESRALGFSHPKGMKPVEWVARAHLRRSVADPELRRRLTPDYQVGCKRILLSNDYYPALTLPQVELVNGAPTALREHAIVGSDGRERPVDVVILGTGFEVVDSFRRLSITGPGGRALAAAWAGGIEAYLGTLVAGFPNLFLLLGPNSGLGHNSVVMMAEQQMRFTLRCLELIRQSGASQLSVRPQAQAAYNQRIQRRLRRAVWSAGGCESWYLDADGVNRTLWPGAAWRFAWRARRPDLAHLQLSGPPAAPAPAS